MNEENNNRNSEVNTARSSNILRKKAKPIQMDDSPMT